MKNLLFFGSVMPVLAAPFDATSPGCVSYLQNADVESPTSNLAGFSTIHFSLPLRTQQRVLHTANATCDRRHKSLGLDSAWNQRTSFAYKFEAASEQLLKVTSVRANAIDPATYLLKIKVTFGLSVKDLAYAMRVQRPAVYSWMRGESKLQLANQSRLIQLSAIASSCEKLIEKISPKHLATFTDGEGQRLLDLLNRNELDSKRIESFVRSAASASSTPPSLADRIKAKGRSVEQFASANLAMDILTGKRLHNE